MVDKYSAWHQSTQIGHWKVARSWTAVAMEALVMEEGWIPMEFWSPNSAPEIRQAFSDACIEAASPEDWELLCATARQALRLGHESAVAHQTAEHSPGSRESTGAGNLSTSGSPPCSSSSCNIKTVHGDVRLCNILAKRTTDRRGFDVKFVDFGWAGEEGKSRCAS